MGRSTWIRYAARLLGVIVLQAAFFLLAILVVIPALPQTAEAIRVVVIITGYLLPLAAGLLVPREWTVRRRLIVSGASAAVLASILNIDAPAVGISAEVGHLAFAVQVLLAALISVAPSKASHLRTA